LEDKVLFIRIELVHLLFLFYKLCKIRLSAQKEIVVLILITRW